MDTLAAQKLSFDDPIGAAHARVLYRESLLEQSLNAELWWSEAAAAAATASGGAPVALGHQQDSAGEMPCPATADSDSPSPRLAAVALVMDPVRRCVLLTRRPTSMRTFPGAWVLPGGSVDAGDGSTLNAALRELAEETGLTPMPTADGEVRDATPLCLWESCYPPSFALWRSCREAGGRCSHFLIAYHMVAVDAQQPLTLQPSECDCAVWVPVDDLAGPLSGRGGEAAPEAYARAPGSPAGAPVPAAQLAGVYPNAVGEGVGRAHLFAISQLAK
tara:strand:- start:471 stop:1295 length:825 start_codon:yes stop_codon:yes gene_type:complete